MSIISIAQEVRRSSSLPESPRPGTMIPYYRNGRRSWGIVWGVQTYQVRRYTVRGEHPVVESYIIEPCDFSSIRYIVVCEEDVDWRALS